MSVVALVRTQLGGFKPTHPTRQAGRGQEMINKEREKERLKLFQADPPNKAGRKLGGV